MNNNTNRLLSTRDAALAVGVEPATIRKWAQRGKLTRHGTPRNALWRIDELAARLAEKPEPLDNNPPRCHDA